MSKTTEVIQGIQEETHLRPVLQTTTRQNRMRPAEKKQHKLTFPSLNRFQERLYRYIVGDPQLFPYPGTDIIDRPFRQIGHPGYILGGTTH